MATSIVDPFKEKKQIVDPFKKEKSIKDPFVEEEEDKTAGFFAGVALGVESLGRIPEATRLAFTKKDEEARIAAQQIAMQRQEAERDYGRIVSFTDVMETIERDIATQSGLDKMTEEDLSHPYLQGMLEEKIDPWAVKGMQDAFFWEMQRRVTQDEKLTAYDDSVVKGAEFILGNLGMSLPAMAPGVAGGAAMIHSPVIQWISKVLPARYSWWAKPLAFSLGFTLAEAPVHFGQNIERQLDEALRLKEEAAAAKGVSALSLLQTEDIKAGPAAGAAFGQAALDSLFWVLLSGFPASQRVAASILESNRALPLLATTSIVEGTTETAQSILERIQAGLPINDEEGEALKEYLNAFFAGFFVAMPISAAVHYSGTFKDATKPNALFTFEDLEDFPNVDPATGMPYDLENPVDQQIKNRIDDLLVLLTETDRARGEVLERNYEEEEDVLDQYNREIEGIRTRLDDLFILQGDRILLNKTRKELETLQKEQERLAAIPALSKTEDEVEQWTKNKEALASTEEKIAFLEEGVKEIAKSSLPKTPLPERTERKPPVPYTPIPIPDDPSLAPLFEEKDFKGKKVPAKYRKAMVDWELAADILDTYNKLNQQLASLGLSNWKEVTAADSKIVHDIKRDILQLKKASRKLVDNIAIRTSGSKLYASDPDKIDEHISKLEKQLYILIGRIRGDGMPIIPVFFTPDYSNAYVVTSEIEVKNNKTGVISTYQFENLPPDARVILYFYDENNEPLRDTTAEPIIKEDGGLEYPLYSEQYLAADFIDPLTGNASPHENMMPVKMLGGKQYRGRWEGGQSYAEIPLVTEGSSLIEPLEIRAIKVGETTVFPKELKSVYDSIKAFHRPRGALSYPAWYTAKRTQWQLNRELRVSQDMYINMNHLLKKYSDLGWVKRSIPSYWRGETKRLQIAMNNMFSPNKDIRKNGEEYLKENAKDLYKLTKEARTRINKNSAKIIKLLNIIDPESKVYNEAMRNTIMKHFSSYLTDTFAAFNDPLFKPLKRRIGLGPNKRVGFWWYRGFWGQDGGTKGTSKQQYFEAVDALVPYIKRKEGTPPFKSDADRRAKAENILQKLYTGTPVERMEVLSSMGVFPVPEMTREGAIGIPYLKKKKFGKMPKAVRIALGEITEPAMRMQMTAMRQAQFIHGVSMLHQLFDIMNSPGNRQVMPFAQGAYDTEIVPQSLNFKQKEKSEAADLLEPVESADAKTEEDIDTASIINPFSGFFVRPTVARALREIMGAGPMQRFFTDPSQIGIIRSVYGPVLTAKQSVQAALLLYNPSTQFRNLRSAMLGLLGQGNVPLFWPSAVREGFAFIANDFRKMTKADGQRLVDLGVVFTSPNLGELLSLTEDAQGMSSMGELMDSLQQASWFSKARRKIHEKLTVAYQSGDNWPKVINYVIEKRKFGRIFGQDFLENDPRGFFDENVPGKSREYLQERVIHYIKRLGQEEWNSDALARPGNIRLNGSTVAEDFIQALEEIAAARTRQNIPNYDYAPNLSKTLRLSPLANFPLFRIETIRGGFNTLASGVKEGKIGNDMVKEGKATGNPYLIEMGNRLWTRGIVRIGSFMTYTGFMGTMLPFFMAWRHKLPMTAMWGLSMFVADWAKDDNKYIKSVDTETGEITWVNATYNDFWDIWSALPRIFWQAAAEGFYLGRPAEYTWEFLTRSFNYLMEPFLAVSIAPRVLRDATRNFDSETGKTIRDKADNLGTQVVDTFTWMWNRAAPKIVQQTSNIAKDDGTGASTLDRRNVDRSADKQVARVLGGSETTTGTVQVWKEYIIPKYNREVDAATKGFRNTVYEKGREMLTSADIVDAYRDANIKILETTRIHRLYPWVAPMTFGMTPQPFLDALEERKGGMTTDAYLNITMHPGEDALYIPLNYGTRKSKLYLNYLDNLEETREKVARKYVKERGMSKEDAKELADQELKDLYPFEQLGLVYEQFSTKSLDPPKGWKPPSFFNLDPDYTGTTWGPVTVRERPRLDD